MSRFSRRSVVGALALGCQIATVVVIAALGGCKGKTGPHAAPIPSLSNGVAIGLPIQASAIASALNGENLPPYDGPYGIVEGVVKMEGGPLPPSGFSPPAARCPEAAAMYERTGRVAADGALADALVTVTGYHAFVPPPTTPVHIDIRGCAYDRRVVDVTFGQSIEVQNFDSAPYVPHLDGSKADALMVTLPKGAPVRLFPKTPTTMLLMEDTLHPWMSAPVFVLKFPTHAVTTADGHYRIEKIPVGKLKITAFHPALSTVPSQTIEIKDGEVTKLDFTIPFVPEHDVAKPKPSGERVAPVIK